MDLKKPGTIASKTRPTLNADKPSATIDLKIQTWSIMSPNNHLSFSKSYMLSVHEAIKISYSYHLPCQDSRNCQKSNVSNHSFIDMVRSLFQYCPNWPRVMEISNYIWSTVHMEKLQHTRSDDGHVTADRFGFYLPQILPGNAIVD